MAEMEEVKKEEGNKEITHSDILLSSNKKRKNQSNDEDVPAVTGNKVKMSGPLTIGAAPLGKLYRKFQENSIKNYGYFYYFLLFYCCIIIVYNILLFFYNIFYYNIFFFIIFFLDFLVRKFLENSLIK